MKAINKGFEKTAGVTKVRWGYRPAFIPVNEFTVKSNTAMRRLTISGKVEDPYILTGDSLYYL